MKTFLLSVVCLFAAVRRPSPDARSKRIRAAMPPDAIATGGPAAAQAAADVWLAMVDDGQYDSAGGRRRDFPEGRPAGAMD